ncbi:MAG TPA: hypothetical protein VNP36_20515 [Burkholderiales bacterium]|nr:hypothetical protein [Burkholderiales bacterium]
MRNENEQMQALDPQDPRGIAREITLIAGIVAAAIVVALAAPAYAHDRDDGDRDRHRDSTRNLLED